MRDSSTEESARKVSYGGFWRRFVATIIDLAIVSFAVFPLVVAADLIAPNQIEVTTPFGLFSEERVLESKTEPGPDGAKTTTSLVRRTSLGKWTYTYRVVEIEKGGETESESEMIDPVTNQVVRHKTNTSTFNFFALMLYFIAMESSRLQATLGKAALGLKVVDEYGYRLTFLRAAGRNVSKLLSLATSFIGFMMAGWTQRKQALHDKVAGCLVVRE